ncbi:hypothetical protein KVR01_000003 [Diaporthe batatas]|uniref:uncharacterized protein n=1 Tax=Diaporthe batatas TaxID=748121 RepID=UPI001D03EF71|nr:uncharacterized protein KVR01_000003 [Diaporthe batatas]KAG8169258.1 hypothetical protein KVR01_000003 [Diaporthe batatas]
MEAAASIVGIVSFGLGLAKSLQTFVETVIEAEETIVLIVSEVHATASTLKRLQDFIEQDKSAGKEQHRATVLNDTGLKEIGVCASQCQRIYVQIIVLIEKASIQNGEDGSKGKGPQTSAADDPNATALRLDVFSKNVTKLGRKMRWPWLEPRIKRCQEHLGRLKVSLMLSLQVFLIAESRSRPLIAWVSDTNDEDGLRDRAEALRKKMTELHGKQNQPKPPKMQPPGLGDGVRVLSVVSSMTSEAPYFSGYSGVTSSSNESMGDGHSSPSYYSLGSDRPRRRRRSRGFRTVRALRTFKAHVRKRTERRSVFKKDSTSAIFAAYLVDSRIRRPLGHGGTTPFAPSMKLPFGHRRLTQEIKRALRKCNPWDVLLKLSPAHRDMINQVVQQIEAATSNMSVCLVAVDLDGYVDGSVSDLGMKFTDLSWERMVLFFRFEPVYSEQDPAEPWLRAISGPSRFLSLFDNVFQSSLRTNTNRKKLQARINWEKDERKREEAKTKADKEILEKSKAEVEENMQAVEVEKDRIREEKRDLEAERTRIAEEKESVESRNRALRDAELAVLESIRGGTAGKDLERMFEEERARSLREGERAMKTTKNELARRRLEEEHAKKAKAEKAEAEKAAMEQERAAAERAKPPVKFKDAVGRKFTFPFHLVKTWKGMEDLIKQSFLQVEGIGPHVQEGQYDLVDSEEQIILPSAWAESVKPGASISMRMWPVEPPLTTRGNQYMHPRQGEPFEMPRPRGYDSAYPHAGHTHNISGLSGTWSSPDAWAPVGGSVPPVIAPPPLGGYLGRAHAPFGGARPPPPRVEELRPPMVDIIDGGRPLKDKKGKRRKKKKPTFLGGTFRRMRKSLGPKKPVNVEPRVDPRAKKSTREDERVVVEEFSHTDDLAEEIDKELGLDDLDVSEKIASKEIDELLQAWTNAERDGNQEHASSSSSERLSGRYQRD